MARKQFGPSDQHHPILVCSRPHKTICADGSANIRLKLLTSEHRPSMIGFCPYDQTLLRRSLSCLAMPAHQHSLDIYARRAPLFLPSTPPSLRVPSARKHPPVPSYCPSMEQPSARASLFPPPTQRRHPAAAPMERPPSHTPRLQILVRVRTPAQSGQRVLH